MASHSEISVGDTNWVIRIGGQDTPVKVLEKRKKASGRGWEFRCKRLQDGVASGRDLVRGAGSLRLVGAPVRAFAGSAPARPARATRATPRPAPARKNPPASAFFSEVREPGDAPRGREGGGRGKLGSLRGRASATATPKPAAARQDSTSPSSARREIERLLKHAGQSPLVTNLIKLLTNCDGSESAASRIYGDAMAEHRMGPYFSHRR